MTLMLAECVIKGLYIYLNEDPDDLVQEYMVSVCKSMLCFCHIKRTKFIETSLDKKKQARL